MLERQYKQTRDKSYFNETDSLFWKCVLAGICRENLFQVTAYE